MTTASTGLLCWRDFHPQEWQLASLHWLPACQPCPDLPSSVQPSKGGALTLALVLQTKAFTAAQAVGAVQDTACLPTPRTTVPCIELTKVGLRLLNDSPSDAHAAHQPPVTVQLAVLLAKRMAQVHAPSAGAKSPKKIGLVGTTCSQSPKARPKSLIRLDPIRQKSQNPSPTAQTGPSTLSPDRPQCRAVQKSQRCPECITESSSSRCRCGPASGPGGIGPLPREAARPRWLVLDLLEERR
jgi:hypothetical protein